MDEMTQFFWHFNRHGNRLVMKPIENELRVETLENI